MFVRFAGCNVWTGREQDRPRDVAKGCCAAWCDTKFVGTDGENGGTYSAEAVAQLVVRLWAHEHRPMHVVLTGGEPTLVVDDRLVAALHDVGAFVQIETNGSRRIPDAVDWRTLSPKPPMPVVEQRYDEVKCVHPAGFNPDDYAKHAQVRFVQPLDNAASAGNVEACVAFVQAHPAWALSLQTHKTIGLP